MPPKGVSKAVNKKCRECKKQVRERDTSFGCRGSISPYFPLFPPLILFCCASPHSSEPVWEREKAGGKSRRVKKGEGFSERRFFFSFFLKPLSSETKLRKREIERTRRKVIFLPLFRLTPHTSFTSLA